MHTRACFGLLGPVLLAGVFLSLAVAETKVPAMRKVGDKILREGMELDHEQEEALPDTSDPKTMKEMKCGVCQASVMEMAYAINKKETDEGRKMTEVEIVEILDRICDKNLDQYGLILDDKGKPTDKWSNDDRVLRAKGGWVTRLARGTCSDIYNEYEDFLVEMAPKSCTVDRGTKTCQTRDLVVEVCAKGFKWCDVEKESSNEIPKPALTSQQHRQEEL